MSLFDYEYSRRVLAEDPPFYGLVMALIRKADDKNIWLLRKAWPEVYDEFKRRYEAPGGVLPEDDR